MQTTKKARKFLFNIYLFGFIFLFFIVLAQTVFGKYLEYFYVPWIWVFVIYGPLLLLSYKIKDSGRRTKSARLLTISISYVLATLAVIISLPILWKNGPEIAQYKSFVNTIIKSTIFLVPLELLLLFWIKSAFYKLKTQDDKNETAIIDPKIFISYNHNDSKVALKIRDILQNEGYDIIIDQDDMLAGTKIKTFIENSIKESTITISLVSNKSLKSAWVAMETIDSFFQARYDENKKFIACYLDDDFFQKDFTLKAIDKIDLQIKENQNLISEYHEKMIDTRDLNDENTRLLALRNNLDGIIGKLRESLSLDVREDLFQENMKRLIVAIDSNLST